MSEVTDRIIAEAALARLSESKVSSKANKTSLTSLIDEVDNLNGVVSYSGYPTAPLDLANPDAWFREIENDEDGFDNEFLSEKPTLDADNHRIFSFDMDEDGTFVGNIEEFSEGGLGQVWPIWWLPMSTSVGPDEVSGLKFIGEGTGFATSGLFGSRSGLSTDFGVDLDTRLSYVESWTTAAPLGQLSPKPWDGVAPDGTGQTNAIENPGALFVMLQPQGSTGSGSSDMGRMKELIVKVEEKFIDDRILDKVARLYAPFPPYVTVDRPNAGDFPQGGTYYDVDLAKPAWSDSSVWRDAAGVIIE